MQEATHDYGVRAARYSGVDNFIRVGPGIIREVVSISKEEADLLMSPTEGIEIEED